MASGTRKRKRTRTVAVESGDGSDTGGGADINASSVRIPRPHRSTGCRFVSSEVEWKYERLHLLDKPHKVIPGGYETMSNDVNKGLKSIPIPKSDVVRRSVMGDYMRVFEQTTRIGKMLHFVLCHQVFLVPAVDPTALFFKIGDTVLRLPRKEYNLVSGLRFRPSTFDPHCVGTLPPGSVFERLFGRYEDVTTADVRAAYMSREFVVNR